jgi:hypothetical protein
LESQAVSLIRWEKGTTHFKSALTPGKVERHQRKADRAKALEEAYAVVDKRDGNRCRVSGVALVAGAPDPKVRREHHHLAKRSTNRSLRDSASNIALVSAFAHDLITRGWLVCEGTDANQALFWHYSEIATSHPLRIKRTNPTPTIRQEQRG